MEPVEDYWAIKPRQTTLRHRVWCSGVSLHSGKESRVELAPAPANTGVVFHMMQENGEYTVIPAHIDYVRDGAFRTVLAKDKVKISTTEHLLAAMSAMGIDNCIVQVWGSEIPIFSGSAAEWFFLLGCAGKAELTEPRFYIQVLREITVEHNQTWCRLEPAPVFSLHYHLNYPHPKIRNQEFSFELTETGFERQIARARTFGFIEDLDMLRQRNLAAGAGLHNTVVFDSERVVNQEGLLWQDEPVRHKIVDAIGDLQLAGAPLQAKFTGFQSGHTLNHRLVEKLFSDSRNWVWN